MCAFGFKVCFAFKKFYKKINLKPTLKLKPQANEMAQKFFINVTIAGPEHKENLTVKAF